MPRLLQTASHYEALKCFLHGFLAVAGVHPDLAENAPFDLSRLSAADREHANQVTWMWIHTDTNTVEDHHNGRSPTAALTARILDCTPAAGRLLAVASAGCLLTHPSERSAMQTDIACKSLGADSHGDAFGRVCYLRGDVWRGQIRDRVLPLLKAFGASRRDIMVRLHDWASTKADTCVNHTLYCMLLMSSC